MVFDGTKRYLWLWGFKVTSRLNWLCVLVCVCVFVRELGYIDDLPQIDALFE